MGWAIGYDSNNKRDIGYGVPAICDHPDCSEAIDRGLSYVCGGEPFGGNTGCGLFFCGKHLAHYEGQQQCERCGNPADSDDVRPFDPKPDTKEWINWKMTDESWAEWREENPDFVAAHTHSLTEADNG